MINEPLSYENPSISLLFYFSLAYFQKLLYLCTLNVYWSNMSETKSTITGLAKGIFKDRGSKFLAFAEPIANEDEAKARIAWYKKKYHDARHVCYAYRLGENLWRTKDDGEPHGTAGMPILRSIDAQKLDNILVVVVRYFGGTLLGTGGLMVAYREATKEALKNAEINA